MAAIVTAMSALRYAMNLAHLITATDNAGHRSFNVAAPGFKLDFIERDAESARANLFSIPPVVKINVPEAKIVGFITDRSAAGADGAAFHLAVILPVTIMAIMAVMAVAAIADRAIATIIIAEMQCAISSLHRETSGDAFARLAMISKGWCCEEQWRRKG